MHFLSHTRHISHAQWSHPASGCPRRQHRHRTVPCLQKVPTDSTAADGTTDIDHEMGGAPWSCAIQQSWSSDPSNLCLGLLALSIVLSVLSF